MIDKRNSPVGRNPVVVSIILGLWISQVLTLVNVFLVTNLQSFSGVIQGWTGVAYNVLGVIACSLCLLGIWKQGLNVPVGKFVTGLIIEQWGKGCLGLVVIAYSIHVTLRPGGTFPFLLVLLGIGCLWRGYDIRKELKEIQKDLILLKRLQGYSKDGGS